MRRELGEGRTAAEAGVGLCLTAKRSVQRLASGAREESLGYERGGRSEELRCPGEGWRAE